MTALPLRAEPLALAWPVECTLQQTCFLQQYVDRDPGPNAQDYLCGDLSYDGHTGTDIRVADLAAMAQKFNVTAAAPGRVRALRDGVEDAFLTPARRAELVGQGCGNGVVIDHRDGWQTQYCHLQQGSIRVVSGQTVDAGDVLGEIGLSGFTDFPHLEFLVRHDGIIVDPFAPDPERACAETQTQLWQDEIVYQPGGFLSAGFATAVPDFEAIRAGTAGASALSAGADAAVLWAYAFGAQSGDTLRLLIQDPETKLLLDHSAPLERAQAELFRAAGLRRPANGWPGRLTGEISLIRQGQVIDQKDVSVQIND